jgi:hypothetical protein
MRIRRNTPRQPSHELCPNCGTPLNSNHRFCPQCGQVNHDLNLTVHHVLGEMMEGWLHFDNKSFQTIRKLIFHPGYLTGEFIRGRRVKYVAPIRLYIFLSFFFFLLLGQPVEKYTESQKDDIGGFSISFYNINSQDLRGFTSVQIDSVMSRHDIKRTIFNTYLVRQLARIGSGGSNEFKHMLLKAVSYMMFALMPVFAFFVYLLHRKKEHWYMHTLIFSVHFHCFTFLLLILSQVVYHLTGISELFLTVPVILPLYLFLAFRSIYSNSRFLTLVKTIVIGFFHAASMVVLFILTALITMLVF